MNSIRLITLAPGHFHAALVQKRMLPGIDPRASVYAPLDRDLAAHIDRVASFNSRADSPTTWELDVHAGPDWLERFTRERPGNVVMLSGQNRPKIDLMEKAVSLGLHVLADKPWIVEASDFPRIEPLLREADSRGVIVWDMMTERHEVTSRVQRELIRRPDIFGEWQTGSEHDPALVIESAHCLKKLVAGRPLARPWWWFDAGISGEAMADVGTHLADLAMWLIAPSTAFDHERDVKLVAAERWPLMLTEKQFAEVTGLPGFPRELEARLEESELPYDGNNSASLLLRGVHVKLVTRWDYESQGAGDLHSAVARGTKATVAIRQTTEAGSKPEIFVSATNPVEQPLLVAKLKEICREWRAEFPGLRVADLGDLARIVVPDSLRIGHEAHFAEVLAEFIRYYHDPSAIPAWERPNLLAKYHITTSAVDLARRS